MSLSIIIPVYNESKQIQYTIKKLLKFKKNIKNLEIIFINDFSKDNTYEVIKKNIRRKKFIKLVNNKKKGLGFAIQIGILKSKKKYVCIFMADLSDDLSDVKKYYNLISNKKIDAVFGTRFSKNSRVYNYPFIKLILNRIFNNIVKLLFFTSYNDLTNAFKIYKRKTLIKMLPISSENFDVFLELPLKIIIRKGKYIITSINWKNRKKGKSNFKIKELSSKYAYTLYRCILEKYLNIKISK